MKKRWLLALTVVMALSFSSTQVFAKEQAAVQQTKVFVDGDAIKFTVDPLNENGSTLVQFKPVFEKLGLEVTWDQATQTVTGTTYNLDIQLTIGSKTVLVNGEKKQLIVAPKIVKNVTMIPLRFVGEASGREVSWDGRTKTVYIASTNDQILHVIAQNFIYSQYEDVAGFISTLDPANPGIEQIAAQLAQINAVYDLNYVLDNVEISSVKQDKATVKITQTTTKVSGPEFANSKVDTTTNLVRVNGEWKLSDSKILKIDYLKQDLLKESKVTLSEDEQKQILAVLEKNRLSGEKEDLEALKSTFDPAYPDLDARMAQMTQLFAAYDFKTDVSDYKFLGNTEDEVKVYSIGTLVKVKGPEFADYKAACIDTLKKNKAGEWKIIKSDTLNIEFIQQS